MPRKPNATFYKRGKSSSISFRYYDEHGRQRKKLAPTLTGANATRETEARS